MPERRWLSVGAFFIAFTSFLNALAIYYAHDGALLLLVIFLTSLLGYGLAWRYDQRQQRLARQQAIDDVREMLSDTLRNQLAIITLNASMFQDKEQRSQRIQTSALALTEQLDTLSAETLDAWCNRYHAATPKNQITF